MIQLREVSKTVKSGDQPLTILHPLTLDIPDGQFIAIVGPSGSGKSTLLGLIAGLDAPTSGAVLIDGVDITRLDEDARAPARREDRLRVSVLSSDSIAHGVRERRGADGDRRVGRRPAPDRRAAAGSGADRARASLPLAALRRRTAEGRSARALANAPAIVLADEPTGNLDTATGRHILELLREIHRARGTTIILVTHDAELAAIADSRLVLRDGRVVEHV